MKIRLRLRWLGALALLLVLAACSPSDGDAADTTAAPDTTEAAAPDTTEAAAPDTTDPAPAEPIKIGMLTDLTSTFAPWGVHVRDGMLMAAEEINAAGGVDGRMIEIVEADSQNDADASAEKTES